MGKFFLHEHPACASSWKDVEIQALAGEPGIFVVEGPMCRWGLKDLIGSGHIRKQTRWMTNPAESGEILQSQCDNKGDLVKAALRALQRVSQSRQTSAFHKQCKHIPFILSGTRNSKNVVTLGRDSPLLRLPG